MWRGVEGMSGGEEKRTQCSLVAADTVMAGFLLIIVLNSLSMYVRMRKLLPFVQAKFHLAQKQTLRWS